MSHFSCRCGYDIRDISCPSTHEAHLVTDMEQADCAGMVRTVDEGCAEVSPMTHKDLIRHLTAVQSLEQPPPLSQVPTLEEWVRSKQALIAQLQGELRSNRYASTSFVTERRARIRELSAEVRQLRSRIALARQTSLPGVK